MAEEARFDWSEIFRSVAIIVVITAIYGFAVPVIITFISKGNNTGPAAGNELYRWGFWAIAWGLTIWRGSVMLKQVHDRIIDDMLVMSVVIAILLMVIKFIIALVYVPLKDNGTQQALITSIDAGGALVLLVVALVGARINKY